MNPPDHAPYALIVEPNEKYAFLIQRYVETVGLRAVIVANPRKAFEIAATQTPVLLVVDSVLNGETLEAFLVSFRGDARHKMVPTIACHWAHERFSPLPTWEPMVLIEKPVGFADFSKALKKLGVALSTSDSRTEEVN